MQTAGYSTIVQESAIMALGPFRQATSRATDVMWAPNQSIVLRTYGTQARYDEPVEVQVLNNLLHPLAQLELLDSSYADMLLTEDVLSRDWDSPEDNAAWADL